MENKELLNQKNRLEDEIGDAYMQLSAVCHAMDLALNDLYDCLKMPDVFMQTIKTDHLVLYQQRNVIYDVLKRFEQIAPDDCRADLF